MQNQCLNEAALPFTQRILMYGRMIRFSHTIFALPFALSAVVLAHRFHPITVSDIFWILTAMVGARSAAMGFNRIVDASIDARNPRTTNREIPSGTLSSLSAAIFVVLFSCLFIFASAMLDRICLYWSLPVLGIIFFYSYTKRFTWLSHVYLGFAISLAPIGAWIAIAKTFSWSIVLLSLSLMTYIAGFDILYACQDIHFDRQEKLFSIPAQFGVKKALFLSSLLHAVSFFFLLTIFYAFQMNLIYLISVGFIGLLYIIEHRLMKPDDLSQINIAFFHVNSLISIVLFVGILANELAG